MEELARADESELETVLQAVERDDSGDDEEGPICDQQDLLLGAKD